MHRRAETEPTAFVHPCENLAKLDADGRLPTIERCVYCHEATDCVEDAGNVCCPDCYDSHDWRQVHPVVLGGQRWHLWGSTNGHHWHLKCMTVRLRLATFGTRREAAAHAAIVGARYRPKAGPEGDRYLHVEVRAHGRRECDCHTQEEAIEELALLEQGWTGVRQ